MEMKCEDIQTATILGVYNQLSFFLILLNEANFSEDES